ncbi:MAG TPA: hypothetical protein VN456_15640 [Desulfosporosinus sp.]|nr:hypothetical protein [Desulfosporosinus sp.]
MDGVNCTPNHSDVAITLILQSELRQNLWVILNVNLAMLSLRNISAIDATLLDGLALQVNTIEAGNDVGRKCG